MPIVSPPGKKAQGVAAGAMIGAGQEVSNFLKFPKVMLDFLRSSPELVQRLGGPSQAWGYMMGQWNKATPQEKAEIFKAVGSVVGGIAGTAAGAGVASIPAAGAGAVLGRTAAAEIAERYFGVPKPPPSEEARQAAAAFTGGGLGQAGGMAMEKVMKPVIQAVRHPMATAGNAIKSRYLTPRDPETISTAIQAAKEGVPLPIGGQSERPLAQMAQVVTRFNVFARDIIDDALVRAQEAWQDYLQRTAAAITGRGETSAAEAGSIIRAARQNAIEAFQTASKGMYDKFRQEFGDVLVDMEDFGSRAREFLKEQLSEEGRKIFPPEALRTLEAAANIKPKLSREASGVLDELNRMAKGAGGREASDLPKSVVDSYIARRSGELGLDATDLESLGAYMEPPRVTMTQMHNMRSELLRLGRRLGDKDPGIEKKVLFDLTDAADDAIEKSLPIAGQQEYSSINKFYREGKEQLFGPAARRKAGNLMADTIDATRDDSGLVSAIVKPGRPDRLESALRAVTPPGARAAPAEVEQALRRATLDDLVSRSAIEAKETSDLVVNPFKLRKQIFKLKETGHRLFGVNQQQMDDLFDVGQAIYKTERRFANPSGTAFAGQATQVALHTIPGAVLGLGTLAATGSPNAALGAALGTIGGGLALRRLGKKIVQPDFLAPTPTTTPFTGLVAHPAATAAAIRAGVERGKMQQQAAPAELTGETIEDVMKKQQTITEPQRPEETVEEYMKRLGLGVQ